MSEKAPAFTAHLARMVRVVAPVSFRDQSNMHHRANRGEDCMATEDIVDGSQACASRLV